MITIVKVNIKNRQRKIYFLELMCHNFNELRIKQKNKSLTKNNSLNIIFLETGFNKKQLFRNTVKKKSKCNTQDDKSDLKKTVKSDGRTLKQFI